MRKTFKKIASIVLTSTMLAGLLAGCGSSGSASSDSKTSTSAAKPSGGGEALTIYTAFPEAEVEYYIDAFSKETGIKCNYIRLSAGEMLTRVAAEKENPQ